MGTRHFQKVITKEGEVKIAQYGQWDGYPSGQGVDILKYLKSGDLDKYQKNLSVIPQVTEEQGKEVDRDKDWKKKYPYLSRDCGSNIHQMIEEGAVKFVQHMEDDEAGKWCEGFYVIDFSKNEFVSVYHEHESVYKLDDLPTEEKYLDDMGENDDD